MGTTGIATIMGTCMATHMAAISIAPATDITSTARCIVRGAIITTTAMCMAIRTARTWTADTTAVMSIAACIDRITTITNR